MNAELKNNIIILSLCLCMFSPTATEMVQNMLSFSLFPVVLAQANILALSKACSLCSLWSLCGSFSTVTSCGFTLCKFCKMIDRVYQSDFWTVVVFSFIMSGLLLFVIFVCKLNILKVFAFYVAIIFDGWFCVECLCSVCLFCLFVFYLY